MYQVMINASGFLLRLLVDSRYRIFRHFLLFFLSMLIREFLSGFDRGEGVFDKK